MVVYQVSLQFNININYSDWNFILGVTLWAPRLESLNLSACYDITDIEILDTHELAVGLPAGFKQSKFDIDLTGICMHDAELLEYLQEHPRVRTVIYPTDDEP